MKTKEQLKTIAEQISNENEKVKSLIVQMSKDGDCIIFTGKRTKCYGNEASEKQIDYIRSLAQSQSTSNLRKLNKWQASSIIGAIKEHNLDKEECYVAL